MPGIDVRTLIVALVAAVLAGFSYAPRHVAVVAWVWPAMMLYLVRGRPLRGAVKILLPSMLIASVIGYTAMVWDTMSGNMSLVEAVPLTIVLLVAIAVVLSVPFLADNLVYPRCGRALSLLSFPFLLASWEMVFSLLPFGTLTSVAYSQIGFLQIMQGLSVFGTFGMSFLIGFFATGVHYVVTECAPARKRFFIDLSGCGAEDRRIDVPPTVIKPCGPYLLV